MYDTLFADAAGDTICIADASGNKKSVKTTCRLYKILNVDEIIMTVYIVGHFY